MKKPLSLIDLYRRDYRSVRSPEWMRREIRAIEEMDAANRAAGEAQSEAAQHCALRLRIARECLAELDQP